ncbi:hypothetical protein FACS189418_7890 [Clostridia bacterium]|nr:hypothetical protein FACS189418_7890 [Clostridia bacterium]
MNQELSVLNQIRQSAQSGRDNTSHLIQISDNTRFRHALDQQLRVYENVCANADRIIKSYGREPGIVHPIYKVGSYFSSSFKAMVDHSLSSLAEISIENSTSCMTSLTRTLHDCRNSKKEVVDLANNLIHSEEKHIEEMKKFL